MDLSRLNVPKKAVPKSQDLGLYITYCKEAKVNDYDALRQSFNLRFDTNRTLDSIDDFLTTKGTDEDFFIVSQDAERYKKWYTEHPIKPGQVLTRTPKDSTGCVGD